MIHNNPFKFSFGESIWYLNKDGFSKGKIRSVYFLQDGRNKIGKLVYRIASPTSHPDYQGDEVDEHLIFKTRAEMVEYYSNETITQ